MNAQDLKNSILQLAIQGKLVEQRKEEGSAKELVEQIKAEKEKMIKEGKVKEQKPLPDITEDEIPFEIPQSWVWVRLRDLGITQTGNTPSRSHMDYFGDYIPFIAPGDILNGEINYQNHGLSIEGKKVGRISEENSILQVCIGGSIGKCAINAIEVAYNQQINAITPILTNYSFLYHLMDSHDFLLNMKSRATGTATPIINKSAWESLVVPLPPLEEQKRIVAKIEELIPYIEEYGEAHSKVEELNKKFPEDMQKSILQYAIQGKLVEQREEEGTAEELYQQIQEEKAKLIKEGKIKKEKPLAEMTEDEVPYEIPLSWKWVRLNEISLKIADIDHKMPPTVEKGYPYVSPLNFTTDSIDYDSAKKIGRKDFEHLSRKIKPERNDIIFPRYGTIGVVRLVDTDKEFLVSYSCCTIKTMKKYVLPLFVFYTLKSGMIKGEISRYINKTTQPNVGLESIKKFVFPLPPLQEQKRIVAKIEKLMPHCQQLVE